MHCVRVHLSNNTGFPVVCDGKAEVKFGRIHGTDTCRRINHGESGYFTVRANAGRGSQCKVYFRVEGSGSAHGRRTDDGICVYVRDDAEHSLDVLQETGCHYVRVYPGQNNDGRFYGNFNQTYPLEIADSEMDALVSEAHITLEPATTPNRFALLSDLHCVAGVDDSPASALASHLHRWLTLEATRCLGVVTVGDMVQDGEDMSATLRNQRRACQWFSQQEWCKPPFAGQRACMPGPVYEGIGNHDDGWDTRDRTINRSSSFEPRRWQVHAKESFYSWQWRGVRFIHLHVWPGRGRPTPACPGAAGPRSDSRNSLLFLLEELRGNGRSPGLSHGREPYVVLFHFGLRPSPANDAVWGEADKAAFYDVVAEHPPLCIFTSHDHAPEPEAYRWRPADRSGPSLLVYNAASTVADPCYWAVRVDPGEVMPIRAEYASGRSVDLADRFNQARDGVMKSSS